MKTQNISIETITQAGHDEDDAPMIRALCAYLDCEPDDLSRESYDHYGLALFSQGSRDYAIGTDSECDDAAAKNIEESAWAFRAEFLASFTDLPQEVFEAMQDKCEGANDAFVKLIERTEGGMEAFVSEAVSADGRGHFMSSYDGEENEQSGFAGDVDAHEGDITFFIYRIN